MLDGLEDAFDGALGLEERHVETGRADGVRCVTYSLPTLPYQCSPTPQTLVPHAEAPPLRAR